MKEARLHITEGMRRFLDYPRFAGPTRLLILETQYFFDASWRRAAESLGWAVASVPSAMVGDLPIEHVRTLFTTLGEFKPDFILTSNYAGMDQEGLFSRFFEDARIPYVSWFTDTPRMILYDRKLYTSHYAVAATWEKAYTQHFRDLGFEHVFHMPLATDPALFSGPPAHRFDRPVGFVGAPMIKEASEAWDILRHLPDVQAAIRKTLDEGRATRTNFTEGVRALLEARYLDGRTTSELRNIELCFIYEATRRQREAMVQLLEPLNIEVRGDETWRRIARNAGGAVGYFDDLPKYYRDTAVNLNTTSLQMEYAVNQRVFDCPAAGGFLLTDAQPDLAEFFDPKTEVATYESVEELPDAVAHYLEHPKERLEIILRAQRRITAHHTHAHRLQSLETYLKERYAG